MKQNFDKQQLPGFRIHPGGGRLGAGCERKCFMIELLPCPVCRSPYTYEQNGVLICPECGHEWKVAEESVGEEMITVKDSNGIVLKDGDTVVTIKALPVKGNSQSIKAGTKVKNIRLVAGDHNIDCKIDGFGAMTLKSEFVKKA